MLLIARSKTDAEGGEVTSEQIWSIFTDEYLPAADSDAKWGRFELLSTQTRSDMSGDVVLDVDDLSVVFPTEEGLVKAVSNLSYQARLGRTLAIVGESGSGKSVSSMAVLGLHDARTARITGSIKVGGKEVIGLSEAEMRSMRGNTAAMIFQDALAALHPSTASAPSWPRPTRCTTPRRRRRRRVSTRSTCSPASASRRRRSESISTPTSSRAVCVSGR